MNVIVVGGGPAGLLAGLAAIEAGAIPSDVTVIDFRTEYTRRNMLVLRNQRPQDRKNSLGMYEFKAEFHDLRPNVKNMRILLETEKNTETDPVRIPGLVPIRHFQTYLAVLFERLGGNIVNEFAVGRCDYEDRASVVVTTSERIRDAAQMLEITRTICADTSATTTKTLDDVTYTLRPARIIFEATGAGLGYIKPQDRDFVSYEGCRMCMTPNCKDRCNTECPTRESIESAFYPRWQKDQKQKDLDKFEIDNPKVSMEPTRSVSMIVRFLVEKSRDEKNQSTHTHIADTSGTEQRFELRNLYEFS